MGKGLLAFKLALFLAFIGFVPVLGQNDISSDEKIMIENYFNQQRIDAGIVLKGGSGDIPSLGLTYCSEGGYVDIVPPSWHPLAVSIVWKITTFVGFPVEHPAWGEYVDSGQNTKFRFFPDRVVSPYFGVRIYFSYVQYNNIGLPVGTANNDYTFVYKTPSIYNFGADAQICQGSSVNLNLSNSENGMEYTLRRNGFQTGIPINGNGSPLVFNVSTAGTYTITAVNVAGSFSSTPCEVLMNGAANVVVNPLPVVTAGSNSPVCAGETIDLTSTPGMSTYVWTGPAAFSSPLQNPSRSNATVAMSGTYSVTVTDANSCQNTAQTNVTVNQRPTATISGTTTICNGQSALVSINLTGTSPWTFTYTDGVTPVTINNHPLPLYTFSVSPSANTTYTVSSVSDANTCMLPGIVVGSAVLTVNQRPTSIISGGGTVCNGTPVNLSVVLTGAPPWNLTYSDGVGTTNVVANASPYIITVSPSSTRTYTITALSDNTGCSATPGDMTGSAPVTVNPRPTSSISVDGLSTLCNGGNTNIRFNLTGTAPWNLTYTVNGTPTNVNVVASPYILTVTPGSTTTYTVTALSDANCSAIASDITGNAVVTVNPRPTGNMSGTITLCNGASANITVNLTGTGPWNLTYTVNGSPVSQSGINSNPYVFSVSPSSTTTYILTALSDANGCSALPADLSSNAVVTVNPRPTGVLSGGGTMCNGGNVALNVALTGLGPWTINMAANGVPMPPVVTNISPYNLNVSPSVGTTYSLIGLTDSRCSAIAADLSGTAIVIVNPRPTAVFGSSTTICNGSSTNLSITLTGTPPWNVTYTFNGTPSTILNIGASPYILNVSPSVTTTYRIISVTDNNPCSATPSDISGEPVVTVNPRPTSVISGSTTVCNGTPANLSVSFTGTAPWAFTYTDGVTSWNLVANSSPYIIPVTPNATRTYTITALSDNTGCSAAPADMTGSATVTVNPRPTGAVSIVGGSAFCNGGSTTVRFNLTGTGPWDMTYTINGVPTTVNGISSPYNLPQTPSVTSVYQITALRDANCVANASDFPGSATVTVYPRPTSTISGSATICNGNSTSITINLTGLAPWNITYTVNGVTVAANNILNSPYTINVNPLVNTTYVVTSISDGNGCNATLADMPGSAVVTVNARPTGTLAGGGTICQGASSNLTFNLTGTSPWTINYTANGANQAINGVVTSPHVVSVTPAVNTTYVFTGLFDANCPAQPTDISGTAVLNVNPRPTAVLSGSSTVCVGGSANLRVALTGTAPWSITYTNGVTPVTINNILSSPHFIPVSPAATTTYTLLAASDNFCSSNLSDLSGSAVITVNPLPTGNISGGGTICNGGTRGLTLSFTGTAPWNFNYSDGITTISGTANTSPYVLNVTPSSTRTYTLTSLTDANSCNAIAAGLTGSAVVTVNPRPTAAISGNQSICIGGTANLNVILTGSTPWNITYSDGVSTFSTTAGSSPFALPVSPTATRTYTITGLSDATTCTSVPADLTGSAVVTVNQVAVTMAVQPPANPVNTRVCFGNSITYIATPSLGSGDYSYQYELRLLPAGSWQNVGNSSTYLTSTSLAVGNYEIRVRVTDNLTTCFVTSSVSTFEVLALPPALLNISNYDVCLNSLVTLTGTPTGYSSYIFNINGVNTNNGSNNVLPISTLPVGLNDVFLTVNNGSCSNTTATQQVTVRPLPTTSLSLVGTRSIVCINEPVAFTASGATEYLFYVNGVAQGVRSPLNTFNHFSGDDFSVYVIGFNGFGCQLQSNTINITVNKPVATISVPSSTVCANDVVTFTATGGAMYEFFRNGVSQGLTASSTLVINNPINGDQFYVRVYDAQNCQAVSNVITLTVNPLPIPGLVVTNNPACQGESVTFTASGGNRYTFFVNDIQMQMGTSNTYITSSLNNGDRVYVIVRNLNMCNAISGTIDMVVNPLPAVALTVLPSSHIGEGESVQVVAGGTAEYRFLLNGVPVGAWSTNNIWNFASPANGDIVSVIGRNSFGCTNQHPDITILVDALPNLYELRAVNPSYCENDPGVQLYLSGYEPNVDYLLIDISSGSEVPFGLGSVNGGLMSWNNVTEGNYFVRATRTTGVNTTRDFPDIVTVVSTPAPAVYNLIPNVTLTECFGGINISLSGSDTGFTYTLMLNGTMPIETISGTGSSLSFNPVYYSGTFTIVSQNSVSGCRSIMNGNTFVDAPANSNIFNLTSNPASGRFCPGRSGVELWLEGSDLNVAYALYKDNIQVGTTINGTGNPLLIAQVIEEGVYMVMVAAQGGCIAPMNGSVTTVAESTPTPYNVAADNNGFYCPNSNGVKIRVNGQQLGVLYTLWYGGLSLDTKIGIVDDPLLQIEFDGENNNPGTYTVTGEFPGGCNGLMANSVNLTADILPTAFALAGDAGYCAGGSANVYLNGSQLNVDYELFLNGSSTGTVIPGNGGRLTFVVNQQGDYTIVGTFNNTVTRCSVEMAGTINIVEIPYPDVNLNITADLSGTNCDNGAPVTIEMSEAGVIYELFKFDNGVLVATGNVVTGNGGDVVFPILVVDKNATYRVRATRNGCSVMLTASVLINVPGAISLFSITGNDNVCIGDAGGTIGLSGSELGVDYQLYSIGTGPGGSNSTVGTPMPGTGFPINFGLIAGEGDYYIVGTSVSCTKPMIGIFNLRFNPLPVAYQLTGSGIYCGDVVGANIGLSGSELDVNYKLLWFNGSFNQQMDNIDGSGFPLYFNGQFNQGNYTVYARNNITGCTSSMNGQITVIKLPEPDITAINVDIPSTSYCSFDGGIDIGLTNSESGITYSVVDEISGSVVSSVTPTSAGALMFGNIPAGTYRVEASQSGECIKEIATGIVFTEEPSPVEYVLSGPASGCASSIILNLSGSENGVLYQLYSDAMYSGGNPDGYMGPAYDQTGNGSPLTFDISGFVSGASFFWVKATYTSGCASTTQWVLVNVRQAARPFNIIADSGYEYCANVTGISIGVSTTDTGVGYQLIRGATTVDFIDGTGNPATFGLLHGIGTYFVRARHFESGCSFDSPPFTVSINNMPAIFNLSAGGSVNDHVITLDGSEGGVNYFLYHNGLVVAQPPVPGNIDGSPINFGTVSMPGVYTVYGIGTGGCSSLMNNSTIIFETPLVAIEDTLYLLKGDLIGEVYLGMNDLLLPGVDLPGVNITFQTIGDTPIGTVNLDPTSGLLVYQKLPSFYGKDSLYYVITNTSIPLRSSIAKVIIFVGNKDFGDDFSFLLPNAFSPNGDGINDYFVISGLGATEESSLEVYNRWGTIVYRSRGTRYNNDWGGRSNVGAMVSIGDQLPNGTYYYIFKVKKNLEGKVVTKRYNGFIEIRR